MKNFETWMTYQHGWVRLARTPKAFQLEDMLKVIEHRIKYEGADPAEFKLQHTQLVEALRVQNRIHVFRD